MVLYFDNGSTSFPKPKEVAEAAYEFTVTIGGAYGRGSYERALRTSSIVESCRDDIAALIGADGDNLFWASGATAASNIILNSLNLKGKKVFVSPMEHNAVMRPLVAAGAEWEVLPAISDGTVDLVKLKEIDPESAALVVINHASNVNGVVQPIEEIARWAGDTLLMVDAAQSLGHISINVQTNNIDYLIYTAHKGLFGLAGLGGYYARDTRSLKPMILGGTGVGSGSLEMPEEPLSRMEAGTQNTPAIAALGAALRNRPAPQHSHNDFLELLDNTSKIKGITIYRAIDPEKQAELFSFTHDKTDGSEFVRLLEKRFGIECRYGLNCAPLAHRTLGTIEKGTLRISPGPYHTREDFKYLFNAIKAVTDEDSDV